MEISVMSFFAFLFVAFTASSDVPHIIDFVADTGDGFTPTFSVFATLSQPSLTVEGYSLPRGKELILGGDLVYPHPSLDTFKKKLYRVCAATLSWRPLDLSLKPSKMVQWYSLSMYETLFRHTIRSIIPVLSYRDHILTDLDRRTIYPDPDIPKKVKDHMPRLWAIPGNHDVLDGLYTFDVNILEANYFAGWKLEQRHHHFFFSVPNSSWIVIGIHDQHGAGTATDIDLTEFFYFRDRAAECKNKYVIFIQHNPFWYQHEPIRELRGPRFAQLLELFSENNTVSLFLAGDLHHYSRFNQTQPGNSTWQLIVAGLGGAFTHPTISVPNFLVINGTNYSQQCVYPTVPESWDLLRVSPLYWQYPLSFSCAIFLVRIAASFVVDVPPGFTSALFLSCFLLLWVPVGILNYFDWEAGDLRTLQLVPLGGVCLCFAVLNFKGTWKYSGAISFHFGALAVLAFTPLQTRAHASTFFGLVVHLVFRGIIFPVLCWVFRNPSSMEKFLCFSLPLLFLRPNKPDDQIIYCLIWFVIVGCIVWSHPPVREPELDWNHCWKIMLVLSPILIVVFYTFSLDLIDLFRCDPAKVPEWFSPVMPYPDTIASAFPDEHYKGFVRIAVYPNNSLAIFPIAIRNPREFGELHMWKSCPDANSGLNFICPNHTIVNDVFNSLKFIEPPIWLHPETTCTVDSKNRSFFR